MLTLVLRRGHVNSRENMATAEYRRGHGTLHCEKVIGPGSFWNHWTSGISIGYNNLDTSQHWGQLAACSKFGVPCISSRRILMLNKPKTSWRKLTLERLEDRSMLSCSVPNADFNSSGLVDATDLGVWQIGYGTGIAHNQGDADGDACRSR